MKNYFLIIITSVFCYLIHLFFQYNLINLANSDFGSQYLGFVFYWDGFIAIFLSYFIGGYFLLRFGVFKKNIFVLTYAIISTILIFLTVKVRLYDSFDTLLIVSSYIQFLAPLMASMCFLNKRKLNEN